LALVWAYRIKYYLEKGFWRYSYRYFKIFALRKIGKARLPKLFLCPSHNCNANCPHCYEKYLHKKEGHSLTTEECQDIIDQFHQLGGYFIYFCSGEFLLREDALELIRYCRDKEIIVSLTTNGSLLDEKKIDDLKAAGLRILIVSIDSADAEEHNKLRGIPNCFEKATEALRLAKAKGLKTWIWTYMTKSHQDQLDEIAALARKLEVDSLYVFFTLLSGHLFNKFEENFSVADRNAIRKKYLFQKPIVFEFPSETLASRCNGGGREHICVMPSGDVTFCPPVPYSYGNVKEKPLREIFLDIAKDYEKLAPCTCGQCPVNFPEYRKKCQATFMYPDNN